MKKLLYIGALSALLLAACGDSGDSGSTDSSANEKEVSGKVISDADIQKLYTDPGKYKGYEYEFVGKVFTTPEKDDDGLYLQVWADPEKSEYNTLVAYPKTDVDIDEGDYVKVTSKVKKVYEGENMLGGKVVAPVVTASALEVLDYAAAVAPTLETIEVNKEIDQHGFLLKVEKIEIAEPHTRLYVTVTNNSNDKISFYSHNVKLINGGTQLEEETDYEADYPEVQSDILPGVTTSGIITFPAIDVGTSALKIHAEGYSDNYELDFVPFVFDVAK